MRIVRIGLVCHEFAPPVAPQLSEEDNGRRSRMFRANVATTGDIRPHVEANMTRLSDLRPVWRGISAGGLLYHAHGLIDLSAVAPRFRRQRRDRVMNGRDSQPAVEGLCSPIARSDRNRPSQVLPQTLEEGMADLSLGRFGSVLDLGVNVIWLQSVPKISIERFAELLEDCLQVIGVFPSGLSSLVGARRLVCPFVLGWRLLLFHGAILPKSYPARMGHSGG